MLFSRAETEGIVIRARHETRVMAEGKCILWIFRKFFFGVAMILRCLRGVLEEGDLSIVKSLGTFILP